MRKRVSGWSTAQRAVVVIGWAGLLQAILTWVRADGLEYTFGNDEGWFNYAPNSGAVFSPGGPPPWMTNPTLAMVMQVTVVLLWLLPSFWLFSVRPAGPTEDDLPLEPERP